MYVVVAVAVVASPRPATNVAGVVILVDVIVVIVVGRRGSSELWRS